MSDPLVSVHMITYNHAPYIARAIECVLAQKTSFPFELVIGEDCSTDGTREIVLDYAQRFPETIRVITSDQNVGMQENSNRVNARLRGKYIAWCEGDDYWHRVDKLQLQIDYMENNPACGLVFSDYDVLTVASRQTIFNFIKHHGLQSIENAKIENFLHPDFSGSQTRTCTAVARRCLVEKIIEGDPYLHKSGYFKIGDTQIWAEMSQVSSIHFIDYSLATYLVQSESASNTTSPLRNLKFRLSCSEMYAYLCDKYSVSDDLSKYHNKKVNSLMLRIAFSTRDVELSERVRARNADFKLKEWLFYKGASGGFFYYLVRISLYFRRLIGGVDPLWKF